MVNMGRNLSILIIISFLFATLYSCSDSPTVPSEDPEISEGNLWEPASTLPDTGDTSHYVSTSDLAIDDANNIYVSTDFAGVIKSTDGGMSWTINNNGLKETSEKHYSVFSLGSFNGHLFAGCKGAIYHSSNGGNNWNISYQGIEEDQYITCFRSRNNEIFAGGYRKILKTSNNGQSWHDIGLNINWNEINYIYDIDFSRDGVIYAATFGGLIRSSDNGNNWEEVGISCGSIEIDSNGNIYMVGWNNVYFSSDNAITWTKIFELQADFVILEDIMVNKAGTVFLCTYNGLYRSKNKGQTWSLVGLENKTPVRIMYDKKGKLVAATFREGVYISPQ